MPACPLLANNASAVACSVPSSVINGRPPSQPRDSIGADRHARMARRAISSKDRINPSGGGGLTHHATIVAQAAGSINTTC